MTERKVAGVDWAGGHWLVVRFSERSYVSCSCEENFEDLLKKNKNIDLLLVDIPIGLPEDAETLAIRESLDSKARSITGKPSSVFPVPSREAAQMAAVDHDFSEVVEQNRDDIEKGLSKQSYHIAAAIGEVDELLRNNESARENVVESHPEVCFRGLLNRQLQHSKHSAQGVGERLEALGNQLDEPGNLVKKVTSDLIGESANIGLDDVIDAIALGVVASMPKDDLFYIPDDVEQDRKQIPVRMAYWAQEPFSCQRDL